jgi:hypothetical protein
MDRIYSINKESQQQGNPIPVVLVAIRSSDYPHASDHNVTIRDFFITWPELWTEQGESSACVDVEITYIIGKNIPFHVENPRFRIWHEIC